MRAAVVVAAAVLAMATYASAECANACSGHGVCSTSDQCDCFPNYRAADCSERVCPYGFAWVDSPRGDLNHDGTRTSMNVPVGSYLDVVTYEYESFPNDGVTGKVAKNGEGHFYSECSNKGMCDRALGECVCFDGYTGSSCQRTTCPNDCSGHGVCRTVEEIAKDGLTYRKVDNAGGDSFWEGTSGSSVYRLWDMDMAQSCVCDPGYTGPDCSRRLCPRGDDPLTHRAADCGGNPCTVETQRLEFSTTTTAYTDFVQLTFTDWTGKVWKTETLQITPGSAAGACTTAVAGTAIIPGAAAGATAGDAAADVIEALLEGIPNGILTDVDVAYVSRDTTTLIVDVTFTAKPGNIESIGLIRSDEFFARNDPAGACKNSGIIGVVSLDVSDTLVGNEEESSCSNRGVCDYDTGLCKCFKGYTQDDCSSQNALAQ